MRGLGRDRDLLDHLPCRVERERNSRTDRRPGGGHQEAVLVGVLGIAGSGGRIGSDLRVGVEERRGSGGGFHQLAVLEADAVLGQHLVQRPGNLRKRTHRDGHREEQPDSREAQGFHREETSTWNEKACQTTIALRRAEP
jgi:hypothetical protein